MGVARRFPPSPSRPPGRRGPPKLPPPSEQLARALSLALAAKARANDASGDPRNAARSAILVDAAHAASIEKRLEKRNATSEAPGGVSEATSSREALVTVADDSSSVQPEVGGTSTTSTPPDPIPSNVLAFPMRGDPTRHGARPLAPHLRDTLLTHDAWTGVLAFDEYHDRAIVKRKLPPWGGELGRWTSEDSSLARMWFTEYYHSPIYRDDLADAIASAARHVVFNSLVDEIRLHKWDGVERLSRWLVTYCGADSTPINLAYGRRWLISAVARGLKPGSTVQHALILEGGEDIGKTRMIRAIAGEKNYCDAPLDMGSIMNAPLQISGVWIYLFDELAAIHMASPEVVSQFISLDRDEYIIKHRSEKRRVLRSTVFVGTTTKREYLRDQNGNRKFWPVRVGMGKRGTLDVDGVTRDRDQIIAEAVAAYDAGERWWFNHDDDDLKEAARTSQELRLEIDEWETPVSGWIVKHWSQIQETGYVTAAELLKGALKLDVEKWDKRARGRVAQILERFRWRRGDRVRTGEGRVVPFYPPPPSPVGGDQKAPPVRPVDLDDNA